MLIELQALQHWVDHFYGYGSWGARIWFIGYEEDGGDLPEEVAEKFNYFYKVHPSVTGATLCDIRELYRHTTARLDGSKVGLYPNLYEYRFGSTAHQHGFWKNLIAFAHGYRNENLPDPLPYQKNSFVEPSTQREALIQLYPLPSPHNHAWYYSWLDLPQVSFLKTRKEYEDYLYPGRMNTILNHIGVHKPELVLMYGMNNINTLKKSVLEFYPHTKFKLENAVKLHTPQYHRADFNGTTMLITTQIPGLRHNRIETGFDWQAFGAAVKSGK